MSDIKIGRRVFLGGTGLLAATAINLTNVRPVYADQRVPFSAGTAAPKLKAPANVCDSHIHILIPLSRVAPLEGAAAGQCSGGSLQAVQRRIGTSRVVIVNPSTYGTETALPSMPPPGWGGRARRRGR